MLPFTTEVKIAPSATKISYQDSILMLGSCFSDEISSRLRERYFRVVSNPVGTLYNPISIADAILSTDSQQLIQHNGLWHSFSHHGSFSGVDYGDTLTRCLTATAALQHALNEASVVIITFGTAYVYERDGRVVANCHKFPASEFVRRRLSVDEIVHAWLPILTNYPDKRFIFTVSPIRHLSDGLHENNLSKSILLQSIDSLLSQSLTPHPSSLVSYFPSYEILLDELRDYRFYADDMCHPSSKAVDYIYKRFVDTFFSKETVSESDTLYRFYLDSHHKLLHPDSPESKLFLERLKEKRAALAARYPWI